MTIVWKASRVHSRAQNAWAAIVWILPSIFELRVHYFFVVLNFNSGFSPFWKRMGWCFFFFKIYILVLSIFEKRWHVNVFVSILVSIFEKRCHVNVFVDKFMLFLSTCFCWQVHAFSVHVGSILLLWLSFCCHAFSSGNIKGTSFPLQIIYCFYLFEVYNSVFI